MNSLRLRLLLAAVVGVGLALFVLDLIVWQRFSDYAESEVYDDLEDITQEIVESLPAGPDAPIAIHLLRPQFLNLNSGFYWQLDNGQGLMLRSPSLGDYVIPEPTDDIAPTETHHHRLHGPDGAKILVAENLKTLAGQPKPLRILVAINARQVDQSKRAFRNILVWSSIGLGIALTIAASLQVWIGLRPLEELHRRLHLLRDGKINRLDGGFPVEVASLVEDLNGLLDHQGEVVERGRLMAGNLAHGLKTPLAIIANEAAQLAQTGQQDPSEAIQAQVSRMQRMVDYHTARARAAAARNVPGMRCDVTTALSALKRVIETLYRDKTLEIALSLESALAFKGDRQDLDEMIGNLLDNAAKWARSQIAIQGHLQDGILILFVDDDGPGLPPAHYEEAFARGRRMDEAVPGTGLGLAIVRDLAEMYGGQVSLEQSPLQGLRVCLRLPGDRQS